MYKLDIQNYQIISNGSLLIRPGLTLITGPSNNGKSSIFKAFKQLIYNTSGSDYIKHNTSKATIRLQKLDDYSNVVYDITYTKSTSGASYTTVTPDEGTQVYQKLGSSQPEFIPKLTQINKELDYNFWNQMDKPFLISLSNKEQFDYLQQSPHTQTLQSILQSMQSDKKVYSQNKISLQSKLQLIQEQNTQYQEQLKQLPLIQSMFNSINSLNEQHQSISSLQSTIQKYQSIDTQKLTTLITKLQQIPTTESLTNNYQKLTNTLNQFTSLTQTTVPINQLQNQIQQYHTQIDRLNLILQEHFTVCPLCNQPFHNTH